MISADRQEYLLNRFKGINHHFYPLEERIQWANWLRNTNIPQGNSYLCDPHGRACCLGIYTAKKQKKAITRYMDIGLPLDLPHNGPKFSNGTLPQKLCWLDTEEYARVYPDDLNDIMKLTFEEIALLLTPDPVDLKRDFPIDSMWKLSKEKTKSLKEQIHYSKIPEVI